MIIVYTASILGYNARHLRQGGCHAQKYLPFNQKCLLAFVIPSLMYQAFAEPVVDLGKLKVTKAQASTQGKLGEVIKNRKTLDSENIQSTYDLVRYSTEVDVAQVGRYGNKGFAIRGVDGNRVAMNIDGVPLPTVESNEIFFTIWLSIRRTLQS